MKVIQWLESLSWKSNFSCNFILFYFYKLLFYWVERIKWQSGNLENGFSGTLILQIWAWNSELTKLWGKPSPVAPGTGEGQEFGHHPHHQHRKMRQVEMLTHIPWFVPAPLPGIQVSSGEIPPLQGKVRAGFGLGWAPELGCAQLAKCRTRKAQQRGWSGAAETAPSSCLSVALPQRQSRKALNTS